ncbi:MAG: hypothetical protein ACK5MI_07660 [Mangrovibacterium sp.]
MKTGLKKLVQLRYHSFMRKDNRDIISFAICMLIASSLWFLNALNKEYTINLSYPIKYINLPKDKMLVNTPPDHFNLKVNAGGFSILRHKLSMSFTPLVVNGESFFSELQNSDSSSHIEIPINRLENKIASQISSELKITDIFPNTLVFNFEPLKKKRVKIKPNISYTLAKQHFVSDAITFSPDSITVYGPNSIIDTLQFVFTEKQHYTKLNQSIRRNITIQDINDLQYSPKRVVMNVPIEEFTEKVIDVPIQIINVPDSLNIKLFPDKAKVSFLVSLSHFNSISDQDFRLIVDYNCISDNVAVLKTKLVNSSNYVYAVNTSPSQVEYLILNQKK